MKTSRRHKQKTIPAMIAGLLLMAANVMAQETPAGPLLTQTLGADQIEEVVQISLGLAEKPAGEIRVDYLYSSAEIALPEVHKPQKYMLRGHARIKPGKRVKVEGQGVLLTQDYLAEIMNRPTAVGGFLAAWQSVMRDVSRADPDFLPANRISWQMPGPVGDEELAAAEKRLGMPLPAVYRETMQRSGPWRVSLPNGFSFELLAPAQLVSASDWLQRYTGPVEWDSEENQTKRQQFKSDITFVVVNNDPWVFRRSGAPCDDEQPSFATAQTADERFYTSSVCGTHAQLEAIRRQMLEALFRAFSTPEFTVVDDVHRLRFEQKPSAGKGVLRRYLKADASG
ncbi:MAG: SMI1/KNR4 family protein [Burkholderiales bacterium]|jgi:hypothetical protein|nr:SMI1/KNR4 family protein [Burkholderiales bacterium]